MGLQRFHLLASPNTGQVPHVAHDHTGCTNLRDAPQTSRPRVPLQCVFAWPDAHDTDFVTSEHLEKVDMSDMMEPNKESQVYSCLCFGLKVIRLSNWDY